MVILIAALVIIGTISALGLWALCKGADKADKLNKTIFKNREDA